MYIYKLRWILCIHIATTTHINMDYKQSIHGKREHRRKNEVLHLRNGNEKSRTTFSSMLIYLANSGLHKCTWNNDITMLHIDTVLEMCVSEGILNFFLFLLDERAQIIITFVCATFSKICCVSMPVECASNGKIRIYRFTKPFVIKKNNSIQIATQYNLQQQYENGRFVDGSQKFVLLRQRQSLICV